MRMGNSCGRNPNAYAAALADLSCTGAGTCSTASSSFAFSDSDHLHHAPFPLQHTTGTMRGGGHQHHLSSPTAVLGHQTPPLRSLYTLGRKLGQGQFGTTYLCTDIATGTPLACKSIAKRKLLTPEDVDDVRREIQIMHHLAGHASVVTIRGPYEDPLYVHIVMDLCEGGELFDRIVARGYFSERKAAEIARVVVGVVEACHSLGVMHRDLKPENFLLLNNNPNGAGEDEEDDSVADPTYMYSHGVRGVRSLTLSALARPSWP